MRRGVDRREFLRGAFAAVGVGAAAPSLFARALRSQESRVATDPGGRILVVVQLSGGNDGLNTLVPYADDLYHKARPTLRVDPKDVLRLDDRAGLHPSLAPLRARYDKGEVAVVQGVGYPNPDRSHFRSMEIWHTARVEGPLPRAGWLGRFADAASGPPTLLVHFGSPLPYALEREAGTALAFDGPDAFSMAGDRRFPQDRDEQLAAFRKICDCGGGPASYAEVVRATAASALASAEEVKECVAKGSNKANYPAGQRLPLVARMIGGGMRTRIYYATVYGFDTHANQKGLHGNLLGQFASSVDAFFQDLEAIGRAKDVVLLAFSEFGRRVAENGSGGTDHGTAGPVFLVGPRVKGGLIGEPPNLADLVDGDPKFGIDFRSVYASVLRDGLGADPVAALGGEFAPVPLFAPA
ncbi:MAG TPA: DUF1501 domain-containing protein [Planctomycetota bacterium]|jgi:uncharacterized protein (DUF1501 family)|nr:DUF1501 domain-containing protein [Planctomycetota bacterium]